MENDNFLNESLLSAVKIAASFDTPEIELNKQQGIFRISGNSYPEDPVVFYAPIHKWFTKYAANPNSKTVLEVHFKYFSTSSTQIFFDIFRILEEMKTQGYDVLIRWLYDTENEEIKENGENYSTLFYVPFELVEVKTEGSDNLL